MQIRNRVLLAFGTLFFVTSLLYISTSRLSSPTPSSALSTIPSERKRVKKSGLDKPNEYSEYMQRIRTGHTDSAASYRANYRMAEFTKAYKQVALRKKAKLAWKERGPGNVSGRTRTVSIDPDDPLNTWIAGSVGGGLWRTTDAGKSWQELAPNLPTLSITSLARAKTNPDVLYAGTGEGLVFSGVVGNGLFRSTDRGNTWAQLSSTANNDDFKYINKVLINPTNENEIWVASTSALWVSFDFGMHWTQSFGGTSNVQDIEFSVTSTDTLFLSANGDGIYRSTDGGANWQHVFSSSLGRIDILPTQRADLWYLVCEGSRYYRSDDAGISWAALVNSGTVDDDFIGEQGWFDLCSAIHPFDENILFVGGVHLGKLIVDSTPDESDNGMAQVLENGTSRFLNFNAFGGAYWNGKLATGIEQDAQEIAYTDLRSIEIRFGENRSQLAHRFTVAADAGTLQDGGAGVPDSLYAYKDYVEVPFQVWDIQANKQLMVSFRDNERDGVFDLQSYNSLFSNRAREYIYVHNQVYSTTAQAEIATNGGHLWKTMYFMWPILANGAAWSDRNYETSNLTIKWLQHSEYNTQAVSVGDYYAQWNGNNPDLHPDHHFLETIVTQAEKQEFAVLNANDGGLAFSTDNGKTFEQLTNGYNTTQFYGAAKVKGKEVYFGGMQDNGSYLSENKPDQTGKYNRVIQGDGFEVVCHAEDPDKMIGGSYNNYFKRSVDGGITWTPLFDSEIYGNGPFISRLSASEQEPDLVVALTQKGVWVSDDFGLNWELSPLSEGWDSDIRTKVARISLAQSEVIWAGGGMVNGSESIFVSTNKGQDFRPVSNYSEVGNSYCSNIATHPSKPGAAYVLFSRQGKPKIIATENYGDTWTDLSAFSDGESQNGFPDVAVYSLLVMPYNTDILWAGTEIGLFESTDGGASWHYANNGLPAVAIWQMSIRDAEIVVATHGRGIWTLGLDELLEAPMISSTYEAGNEALIKVILPKNYDRLELTQNGEIIKSWTQKLKGEFSFAIAFASDSEHKYILTGYKDDEVLSSNLLTIQPNLLPELIEATVLDNAIIVRYTLPIAYDQVAIFANNEYVNKGNLQAGEFTDTISVTKSGEYWVKINATTPTSQQSSATKVVFVSPGTTATAANPTTALRVYPNPAKEKLHLQLSVPTGTNRLELALFDLSGKNYWQETRQLKQNTVHEEIDVSALPAGQYLLRISVEKLQITKQIIVVNE